MTSSFWDREDSTKLSHSLSCIKLSKTDRGNRKSRPLPRKEKFIVFINRAKLTHNSNDWVRMAMVLILKR